MFFFHSVTENGSAIMWNQNIWMNKMADRIRRVVVEAKCCFLKSLLTLITSQSILHEQQLKRMWSISTQHFFLDLKAIFPLNQETADFPKVIAIIIIHWHKLWEKQDFLKVFSQLIGIILDGQQLITIVIMLFFYSALHHINNLNALYIKNVIEIIVIEWKSI